MSFQRLFMVILCCSLLPAGGLLTACSDGGSSSSDSTAITSPSQPPGEDSGPAPAAPEPVAPVSSPARLAASSTGILLVSDYGTGRLLFVDTATLAPQGAVSLGGKPTGVAFAGDKIFVGNISQGRVDVFGNQGQSLYSFGDGAGDFAQLKDLAADEDLRRVYVLDAGHARVRVLNYDGTGAGPDIGAGVLARPTALAIDPVTGDLLVSDYGDQNSSQIPGPAILRFDLDGNRLDDVIGSGSGGGGMMGGFMGGFGGGVSGGAVAPEFFSPQGMFVDDRGYLYATDTRSSTILMIELSSNATVKTLGGLGVDEGQLFYPMDVWVDAATGDLFVADNNNGRITVFREGSLLP